MKKLDAELKKYIKEQNNYEIFKGIVICYILFYYLL